MVRIGHKLLRCLLICVALGVPAVGCAAAGEKTSGWWFAKKKVDPNAPPTPSMRLKQLEELGKKSESMTPEEREEHSRLLAQAAMAEPNALIRSQMMRALGHFNTLSSSSALYTGLQDSDPDIRIACCDAWGRRGGPDAAKVLGEIISGDNDIDVRLAAVRALSKVKDQSAVNSLGLALNDPNPALQIRAVRSLEEVTGKHYGNDVMAWRTFVQGGKPREESLVSRLRRMLY